MTTWRARQRTSPASERKMSSGVGTGRAHVCVLAVLDGAVHVLKHVRDAVFLGQIKRHEADEAVVVNLQNRVASEPALLRQATCSAPALPPLRSICRTCHPCCAAARARSTGRPAGDTCGTVCEPRESSEHHLPTTHCSTSALLRLSRSILVSTFTCGSSSCIIAASAACETAEHLSRTLAKRRAPCTRR